MSDLFVHRLGSLPLMWYCRLSVSRLGCPCGLSSGCQYIHSSFRSHSSTQPRWSFTSHALTFRRTWDGCSPGRQESADKKD